MASLAVPLELRSCMRRLRRFLRDDSAIAVTEYGLMVALIAILLIGVLAIFGQDIKNWFAARTSAIVSV